MVSVPYSNHDMAIRPWRFWQEAEMITIYRDAWNQNAEEWNTQDADKAAKSLKQKGFTVEVLEVAPDPNFSFIGSTDDELAAVEGLE